MHIDIILYIHNESIYEYIKGKQLNDRIGIDDMCLIQETISW